MYTYRKNIISTLFISVILILFLIYFNPSFFQKSIEQKVEKLPNDIRWVVQSNEYKALCDKVYDELALKTKSLYSNDRQAIIMDLDETVLDNSQYQVENFYKGETFNMSSWAVWVNREEAGLVPGAKEYIALVRDLGIQLIFLSNRMDERLEATKNNMKKLGVHDEKDIYLLRLDKKDKKHIRRQEVYEGINRMAKHGSFDVILYVGDAMGDFPKNISSDRTYILPNPMYGKW